MDGTLYLATQFVAAAFLFLLMLFLLVVRFRSRPIRYFAAYLLIQGLAILFLALTHLALVLHAPRLEELWTVLNNHALLALAPAIGCFLLAYRPPRSATAQALGTAALLAGGLALQAAYLLRPCLVQCGGTVGPLGPFAFGAPLGCALAGLVLVRSSRAEPGRLASASLIAGSALALNALVDSGLVAVQLAHHPAYLSARHPLAWVLAIYAVRLAGLVPAAVALALGVRINWGTPTRHRSRLLLLLTALAVATPLLAEFVLPAETPQPRVATLLYGLWRMALPAAIAYALLRHRLFGVDVHLKPRLVRAAIVVVFLGLSVGASQVAENFLSPLGAVLGGLLTGVVVIALLPLERLGHRLADTLVPAAAPVDAMPAPDRLALFREQARVVWADGAMARKERLLLDQLRDQLGIPHEVAARIEHEEAAGGVPAPTPRKRPVGQS